MVKGSDVTERMVFVTVPYQPRSQTFITAYAHIASPGVLCR